MATRLKIVAIPTDAILAVTAASNITVTGGGSATMTFPSVSGTLKANDTYYGGAYFYTATGAASTAFVIDTTLLYHGIYLTTTSDNFSGWTHKAGTRATIASVADGGSGTIEVTTSGSHNLAEGDVVTHTGLTTRTTYRGKFRVVNVGAATKYKVTTAYLGTDTGFVQRPYTLTANAGSAGMYLLHFNMCLAPDSATTNFKIEANRTTAAGVTSDLDNMASECFIHTAGEYNTISAGGLVQVADGDSVYLTIANLTDATDLTVRHSNLTVKRA